MTIVNQKLILILHRPQLDENMGMAARAMLNFGLTHLRLVQPRDDHLSEKALRAAAGADDVLKHASVFSSLEEAIADLSCVLGTTARPRDLALPVYDTQTAFPFLRSSSPCGVVFGCEKVGLSNDDLSLLDGLFTFPTNPHFSSLNLSQAVLLVSFLWGQDSFSSRSYPPLDLALKDDLHHFFSRLESSLEEEGFFRVPEKKTLMIHQLRSVFQRASLSSEEIRLLHGLLSCFINKE